MACPVVTADEISYAAGKWRAQGLALRFLHNEDESRNNADSTKIPRARLLSEDEES